MNGSNTAIDECLSHTGSCQRGNIMTKIYIFTSLSWSQVDANRYVLWDCKYNYSLVFLFYKSQFKKLEFERSSSFKIGKLGAIITATGLSMRQLQPERLLSQLAIVRIVCDHPSQFTLWVKIGFATAVVDIAAAASYTVALDEPRELSAFLRLLQMHMNFLLLLLLHLTKRKEGNICSRREEFLLLVGHEYLFWSRSIKLWIIIRRSKFGKSGNTKTGL